MSAGGDAALAVAYSEVGLTEQPPSSNQTHHWTWWGCNLGSWCAAAVSYWCWAGGYPLPVIDPACDPAASGFVGCMSGTVHAYTCGEVVGEPEPGDVLIFSWYPWSIQGGVPIITSGEYAGWVAGDHTGLYVREAGGGYLVTVEGNTSQSSWDNGGAVMERQDRYWGQVCALWRPAIFGGGGAPPPRPQPGDDDMYQTCQVVTAGDPWNGSVFMCAGGRAVGMSDPNIVANLQARGLAGPTIPVEAWDIYGGYEVIFPSGPTGGGRPA